MMTLTEMVTSLTANPYFSAGFGLFGVGIVATASRAAGQLATAICRRHLITTLEVPCNDKSYSWLLGWVTRQAATTSQHLAIRTRWEEQEGGRVSASYSLEPRPGVHVFRWGGAWVKLERVREQHQVDVIGGVPWETLTLTALGRRKELLLKMVDMARHDALEEHLGLTTTYVCGAGGWQEVGQAQPARPIHTVVLDDCLAERLAKDCAEFLATGSWYRARGVPHRRGYLLHGPPGCGKTSLIAALAGELGLGISTLSLSDSHMTDSSLMARLADVPKNTILLLEDIDAAFVSRNEAAAGGATAHGGLSQVTLTGLLNGLDGVVSAAGRITVMTTNYPDRLDPALISVRTISPSYQ